MSKRCRLTTSRSVCITCTADSAHTINLTQPLRAQMKRIHPSLVQLLPEQLEASHKLAFIPSLTKLKEAAKV